MSKTIAGVRRGVALLLSAIICLQGCTAATAPGSFPSQNQFDRGLAEGTIELKVDAGRAQPLVDAEETRRLEEAEVIPLRLVIRNLGTSLVIVESAGIALTLSDGRVLEAIRASRLPYRAQLIRLQHRGDAAPEMASVEPPAPDKDGPRGIGREMGEALLKGALEGFLKPLIIIGIVVAAATSPIWGPPVLISRHVNKPKQRKVDEEEFRNLQLGRLDEVQLMQDEAADGLLYFAVDGDRPDALLATATVVVPVRHADTGEKHSVRLPLGAENESHACREASRHAKGCRKEP